MKYRAEPKPVRRAEGSVPRQNEDRAREPVHISRIEALTEVLPDCWTRVLSKSAGWRRTAESIPDPRPATKWNAVTVRLVAAS